MRGRTFLCPLCLCKNFFFRPSRDSVLLWWSLFARFPSGVPTPLHHFFLCAVSVVVPSLSPHKLVRDLDFFSLDVFFLFGLLCFAFLLPSTLITVFFLVWYHRFLIRYLLLFNLHVKLYRLKLSFSFFSDSFLLLEKDFSCRVLSCEIVLRTVELSWIFIFHLLRFPPYTYPVFVVVHKPLPPLGYPLYVQLYSRSFFSYACVSLLRDLINVPFFSWRA